MSCSSSSKSVSELHSHLSSHFLYFSLLRNQTWCGCDTALRSLLTPIESDVYLYSVSLTLSLFLSEFASQNSNYIALYEIETKNEWAITHSHTQDSWHWGSINERLFQFKMKKQNDSVKNESAIKYTKHNLVCETTIRASGGFKTSMADTFFWFNILTK